MLPGLPETGTGDIIVVAYICELLSDRVAACTIGSRTLSPHCPLTSPDFINVVDCVYYLPVEYTDFQTIAIEEMPTG